MEKLNSTITKLSKIAKGRLPLVAIAMLCIVLSGCSNDLNDLQLPENNSPQLISAAPYSISKGEALDIAGKVLKKPMGRNNTGSMPTFEYVLNERHSRSTFGAETLAYVLNYPNNTGFVIVSTDKRVYPVLGFSDNGNFSFENEIAKTNFTDKIGAYIEEYATDSIFEVSEDDFAGCRIVEPMVQISLSQEYPWNKYVIEEHPDCPAGCVAVATALVMCHSRDTLTYHNSLFHLKSMITAINKKQFSPDPNDNHVTVAPPTPILPVETVNPPYTYEQAVDSMAKLLYWLGKDLNMKYTPEGSFASGQLAYITLKSYNFIVPSKYTVFDINKVCQYLSNNHVVFHSGHGNNGAGGHAWISDGCTFCVNPNDPNDITNAYIHCDWGWGGSSNGYFSGSVFDIGSHEFTVTGYFAVKRGTQFSFGEGTLKP